jgi:Ca2+-binding EF-hand superfamily protein
MIQTGFRTLRRLKCVPAFNGGRVSPLFRTRARACSTNPEEKVNPIDLFNFIDADGQGSISKKEFSDAIDKMSEKEIKTYSKMAFAAIDEDGNGEISKVLYCNFLHYF